MAIVCPRSMGSESCPRRRDNFNYRRIVDQGITIAMEFKGFNGSENGQLAWVRTEGLSESDRFMMIFNMYAGRARLALLKRSVDLNLSLGFILGLFVQPGDWMTAGPPLRSSARLESGTMVTAQLARNPTDLWLRSYKANFFFDKPVEMHSGNDSGVLTPERYPPLPAYSEYPQGRVKTLKAPIEAMPNFSFFETRGRTGEF